MKEEKPKDIRERCFEYALRAIKLCQFLQEGKDGTGWILGKQYLRAATSIGANIEQAQSGQSKADFVHKMSIAQKEGRESLSILGAPARKIRDCSDKPHSIPHLRNRKTHRRYHYHHPQNQTKPFIIHNSQHNSMEIITVNQPHFDLAKVVAEINEKDQPILIQGTTGNAILISEQEWNEIQETLYLQSIPGMVESIHQAAATPIEDCIDVKDIDW